MKSILIIIVLVSIIVKIHLHAYLDWKHKRFKGFKPANMQPIEYFLPYMMDVSSKFEKEKKFCNIFYKSAIVGILLLVLYSLFTGTKLN